MTRIRDLRDPSESDQPSTLSKLRGLLVAKHEQYLHAYIQRLSDGAAKTPARWRLISPPPGFRNLQPRYIADEAPIGNHDGPVHSNSPLSQNATSRASYEDCELSPKSSDSVASEVNPAQVKLDVMQVHNAHDGNTQSFVSICVADDTQSKRETELDQEAQVSKHRAEQVLQSIGDDVDTLTAALADYYKELRRESLEERAEQVLETVDEDIDALDAVLAKYVEELKREAQD